MQATSQTWKDLWASGNARLETVAVIAGTEYTDISTPTINRAILQNGLSIGNAVSATCVFSVRTDNTIPKSAQVQIKTRLTDGTTTSEWIPQGTFYISHRSRDPVTGVTTLECYDALLKANAPMPKLVPWTTSEGEVMTTNTGEWLYFTASYPRPMNDLVVDLALVMGTTIDPATTLKTGAAYVINSVETGQTIHDILCKIAAANGGNWIITPQNTLRLVPIVSAAGAASATQNVVDVAGIVGAISTSRTSTITGIRYTLNGEEQLAGSDTGLVIQADVTQAIAEALLQDLAGMTYQAYDLRGAIYDPAAELGDYLRAGANGEVRSVLCAEMASLGLAFRGDLSAPELGELADEYPYVGATQKTLDKAMQYADNAAASAAQALDNTLTQQEIFDRLTDGGQTQGISLEEPLAPGPSASVPKRIYLNVDYVNDGTMSFRHLRGETLKLGGINNANGTAALYDAEGNLVGVWDNGKFYMGEEYNHVQLYGEATYNGVTKRMPFYAIQTNPGGSPFEMMMVEGMLVLIRGLVGLQLDPDGISITEDTGSGFAAKLNLTDTYLAALSGSDFTIQVDNAALNIVANGLKINGAAGASGTFTTANGKTVTVTKGIITSIA